MLLQAFGDIPNGAKISPLTFDCTQNDTYNINRPAIRCIKIDWRGKACHQCYRLVERFDRGVWQGDAIADSRGAQLLPADECRQDNAGADTGVACNQIAQILENLFFAGSG